MTGLCPLHDDREGSLVMTPAKNLWHCRPFARSSFPRVHAVGLAGLRGKPTGGAA